MNGVVHFGTTDLWANTSSHVIVWHGVVYFTCEHFYYACKLRHFSGRVRKVRSAYRVKEIARSIIREDPEACVEGWCAERKLWTMELTLRLKLWQHRELRDHLLATGNAKLIDATGHPFWGGRKNHRGKLWMKLRDELRETRRRKRNRAAAE